MVPFTNGPCKIVEKLQFLSLEIILILRLFYWDRQHVVSFLVAINGDLLSRIG